MNKKIILSLATVTAIAMSGCSGIDSVKDAVKDAIDESAETGTATYVDSAVEGVRYVCGEKEGFTNEKGEFTFEKGKSCTLYLNNIQLREFVADELKDGKEIKETDLAIARILQTLDSDGDPSNGITIDSELVDTMIEAGITKIPETEEELDKFRDLMNDHEVTVVTEGSAKSHLIETAIFDKTLYQHCQDKTGDWLAELSFSAEGTVTMNDQGEIETTTFKIDDGFLFTMEKDGFEKRTVEISEEYMTFGTGEDDKFYFTKEAAQASKAIDCGDDDDDDDISMGKMELAFSGKTFYSVDEKGVLESMTFSADLKNGTWAEMIGGQNRGIDTIVVDEENMRLTITDPTDGEITTMKVLRIGDTFIDVEFNGKKERIFSDLEEAKQEGVVKFKGMLEGNVFYTGVVGQEFTQWNFSDPFATLTTTQLINGNASEVGNITVDIVDNKYVMTFIPTSSPVVNMALDYFNENISFDLQSEGENLKVFFDKAEAENFFQVIPAP